jgi:hypothetical protein
MTTMTSTSVHALSAERLHGYPRVFVEPLLWLAVTAGVVWTGVALDVRQAIAGGADLPGRLTTLSTAIAVVLLVNGVGALLFASSPGAVSRWLAMLSGMGLVLSSWGLNQITALEPGTRHKMVWGFLVAGIACTLLAAVKWRAIPYARGTDRSWVELLAMGALAVAAVVLAVVCFRTFDQGFVALPRRSSTAWDELLPWWMLLVGVLGTMEQVWSRRWVAAGVTLALGALLAAGVAPA